MLAVFALVILVVVAMKLDARVESPMAHQTEVQRDSSLRMGKVEVERVPVAPAPNYEVQQSPDGSIFYTEKGFRAPGDPAKAPTH